MTLKLSEDAINSRITKVNKIFLSVESDYIRKDGSV